MWWELGFGFDLVVQLGLLRGQLMGLIVSIVRDNEHVAIRVVVDDELQCVLMRQDEVTHRLGLWFRES